jgi:hypothetical protein
MMFHVKLSIISTPVSKYNARGVPKNLCGGKPSLNHNQFHLNNLRSWYVFLILTYRGLQNNELDDDNFDLALGLNPMG